MTFLQPNNVLVAILKEPADFLYAVRESWYRVPLKNSPRVITENKAKYIGFYQNLKFKNAPSRIEYFAEIKNVQQVFRKNLIPDSPPLKKYDKTLLYWYEILYILQNARKGINIDIKQ